MFIKSIILLLIYLSITSVGRCPFGDVLFPLKCHDASKIIINFIKFLKNFYLDY